ncbi:MAG TPA: DUF1501 domain-containing protein [Acidimicrobiales bacterium]|nr:DUF1501 domain-containing protein [Acidimicrobiales bacterium]
MDDLEFDEALPLLSVPAEVHDPRTLSRRRFIQGALLAGAATALPVIRGTDRAGAASPVGAGDGILVVAFLGGGNDGLNTLVPQSGPARARYDQIRPAVSVPAASLLPVGGGWGLHPSLGALQARYRRGQVALVQGAGIAEPDLSHFTATARTMRGSFNGAASGWLGRYLDELPDWDSGMRAMAVASSVPLYLVGARAKVTAIPSHGSLWGADRSDPQEALLMDAVSQLGSQPSGLGRWGDALAANGRDAVRQAQVVDRIVQPSPGAPGLPLDLTLAARLVNADLGTRVVGVTLKGWDTHYAQAGLHAQLLAELDFAIEQFFATLANAYRSRVTLLVQSEFGRRPEQNGSLGTDHGTANLMILAGQNVRGGLHAAAPSLDRLDGRGNLVPSVDHRSVYGSVLERWLGADGRQVLGGSFEHLDLFAAPPGAPRPA